MLVLVFTRTVPLGTRPTAVLQGGRTVLSPVLVSVERSSRVFVGADAWRSMKRLL